MTSIDAPFIFGTCGNLHMHIWWFIAIQWCYLYFWSWVRWNTFSLLQFYLQSGLLFDDTIIIYAHTYWQVHTTLPLSLSFFLSLYIYHHHHHHVALVARVTLTLSRHSSLSFIALGRSSGQHHVSPHSCWMYVHAGRPAFARLCVGVHKSTSLMSSSLLLQQCPACLVCLTWIVFVIGGR